MKRKDSELNGKRDSEKLRLHRTDGTEILLSEKHIDSLFSVLYKHLANGQTRQRYICTMSEFMKLLVVKAFNQLEQNEGGILTFYFDPSFITLDDIRSKLTFVYEFEKKALKHIVNFSKSKRGRKIEVTEMEFLILPILHGIWADNEITVFVASKFQMYPDNNSIKNILHLANKSHKFYYPRSYIDSADVVMKELIEFCENELLAFGLNS